MLEDAQGQGKPGSEPIRKPHVGEEVGRGLIQPQAGLPGDLQTLGEQIGEAAAEHVLGPVVGRAVVDAHLPLAKRPQTLCAEVVEARGLLELEEVVTMAVQGLL